MKKCLLIAALAAFAFGATVDCDRRMVEKSGGFAICPPIRWEAKPVGGFKYNFLMQKPQEGFAANINFADEEYNGSLKEYVDLSLDVLKKMIEDVKIVDRAAFSAKNVKGERIVAQSVQYSFDITQTVYVFDMEKSKKMIVTCTGLTSLAKTTQKICDDSLKTFEKLK
ncbi:MAG: hypothetical protein LBP89_10280 [Helicobacteraceae bacterium]|jgi:hypothetical protein|nr:hypothetical protein [Helicobacteraceae bacterium]